MASPGVTVTASAIASISSAGGSVGTWFVAGVTELGPTTVDSEKPVYSLAEFVTQFGARLSYTTLLYDSVDAYFRSGGTRVYVSRVVGPSATSSSLTLNDRAGTPLATLTVKPKGPGAYGTRLTVQVVNGSGSNTFQLIISFDGVPVEQSYDLSAPTDAVEWAASQSRYVLVTDSGSATAAPNNIPAVLAATALSGGSDDRASITDAQWAAALARFTTTFGPGLVSQPGRTTSTAHGQTITHASVYNRQALLDGPEGAAATTLVSLAGTVRGNSLVDEFGAFFAPWLKCPGVIANTTRKIPPSAVAAGLIARQVAAGSPATPAAGSNGSALWVNDLAQTAFTETELGTLNDAGVNVFRRPYTASNVTLYGYRTLDTVGGWRSLNHQLLRIAITDEAYLIGEDFLFDLIDGRGQKIAEWGGAISSALHEHWLAGELFGEDAAQAFRVDVGPAVNTPQTLSDGELRASLAVRMSPFAEFVVVEIVKYPITESLVA